MAGAKRGASVWPLALVLAVFGAVLAILPFLRGVFPVTAHEIDTLHLSELIFRMADLGERPHFDFDTPLGDLGLWPITAFRAQGLPIGHAIWAAQAVVAAVLFLPVLRVARSRFPGWLGFLYGAYVLTLCLAQAYGGTAAILSPSMHYNRWAWALAYVALPLAAMAPLPGHRAPQLDGLLIGLACAGMALIKLTYVVSFAPALALALLARRDGRGVIFALIGGALVVAGVTLWLGPEYWWAYARDVLEVARSETRAAPGADFADIVSAPGFVAATVTLLAGVVALRRAGLMAEGLSLLLLVPGFLYVTYQNFGNDPQWLILLGLLAFALAPRPAEAEGKEARAGKALAAVGVAALALGAGSAVNMVTSPVRLLVSTQKAPVRLMPGYEGGRDMLSLAERAYKVQRTLPWDGAGEPFAAYRDTPAVPDYPPKPAVLNGIPLPECSLIRGFDATYDSMAKDLVGAGYAGAHVLSADLLSSGLWLFGDLKPVEGAAPWYYGGAPGIAHADYVLVPLCPFAQDRRRIMLDALSKAGWRLEEVRRTDSYILLRPRPPARG